MERLLLSFVLTFCCLLAGTSCHAQQPTILSLNSFGGNGSDGADYVVPTYDGGFIVTLAGNSTGTFGNLDSFCNETQEKTIFLKYNHDASVLEWSRCYENMGDSSFLYMFPQQNGEVVLGGQFWSGFIITKQDQNGNTIWERQFSRDNGPTLRDMIATNDGGFVMFGEALYADSNTISVYGGIDMWALKLDSTGNKMWSRILGGTDWESPQQILEIPGGGYYVLGTTYSHDFDAVTNQGNANILLCKLDSDGNTIWTKCYGGSEGESAYGMCLGGNEHDVIITRATFSGDGDVSNPINVGQGQYNIWVLDVDSSGSIIWNNCYGGGGHEHGVSICKSDDGNIWVGGWSFDDSGGQIDTAYGGLDAIVMRIDSIGNFLSLKVLGSTGYDQIYFVHPLPLSEVFIGGAFSDSNGTFTGVNYYAGGQDAFLARFAPYTTAVTQTFPLEWSVGLFPNPAQEHINIQVITGEKEVLKLVARNIIGQELLTQNIHSNGVTTINVQSWPKGTYLFELRENNRKSAVYKVMVN